ncbi:DUF3197 domain-containing protein [Deinococcus sp. HMF7620]|uniref:DUF3197 domain-containing protein n=1 Tax=Deinococcus arboris TaxID=2682977 RepID=A0A7C9M907_9DEIO|nr:DUF3197 domain-containing protein [Deinococcus arboris]MVN87319.1 DUF3197 domain-containing protein [Deinococcus arboris]
MNITEPLGVGGAPQESWAAVQARFGSAHLSGGQLILVTDRQGEREGAAYGALLHLPGETVVLARAFGPRFGPAGRRALTELVHWGASAGLALREAVVGAPEAAELLTEPDAARVARVVAASAPVDPGIFGGR